MNDKFFILNDKNKTKWTFFFELKTKVYEFYFEKCEVKLTYIVN